MAEKNKTVITAADSISKLSLCITNLSDTMNSDAMKNGSSKNAGIFNLMDSLESKSNSSKSKIAEFTTVINSFVESMSKISGITFSESSKDAISSLSEAISSFIENLPENSADIKNIMTDISMGIASLIKAQSDADSDDMEEGKKSGLNKLGDDIYNFIEKINNAKGLKGFKQFNVEFNKYVKAVNQVDVRKINSLYNLAWTCNELSKRLGSLDKFTKTLANEITKVLTELTKQLNIATQAIDKTEKIQKERHDKIEESAKKIKELLDKEMRVQIVAPEPTETTSESIDSSSGSSVSGASGDTSGSGSVSTVSSSTPTTTSTPAPSSSSSGGASLQQIEQALTNILKKAKLLK